MRAQGADNGVGLGITRVGDEQIHSLGD
jgi:hypothetical protein